MNTRSRRTGLVSASLALAIALSGCDRRPAAPAARPATPPAETAAANASLASRLQSALTTCDPKAWTRLAADVFRSEDASDGVSDLARQWNRPDRPACLDRPLVRASVANVLAQASANGVGEGIDLGSVRDALRKGAESPDWEIAHLSMSGLSVVAEPSDLQLFEHIARSAHGPSRDDALMELASQCSDEATHILDTLAREPGFSDIPDIRRTAAPVRATRCPR